MKFKSQVFTQVSGSVAGLTFGHNRGGLYTRARSIPTNPNTPDQIAARSAMSDIVNAWLSILTQLERDAWEVYAQNTPVIDVFGDPKLLTGQQMYIRSNQPRIRNALGRSDTAPAIFELGTFTTPSIAISAALPNDVVVSFTGTDAWNNEDGSFLIGGISRGQNPTKNFFKSPFRTMGALVGAVIPPASPGTLTSPFPFVEGQKAFATFRAARFDARLSTAQIVNTIVAV